MSLRLSKSQLDKFQDCPRCFWLKHKHGLDQPEMISSKVWKGIERITQAHYETHRQAQTTPSNIIGQVPVGAIPYQGEKIDLKSLRYWGKGLAFEVDGITVTTALDDMLQWTVDGKTKYAVIDYKSKSKETDEASTAELYQNQADVFDLACNLNKHPTDGLVYFDYWYPIEVTAGDQERTLQRWGSQIIALKADHDRVKNLVLAAAACLDSAMPEPNILRVKGKKGEKLEGCPVCIYVQERAQIFYADKEPVAA